MSQRSDSKFCCDSHKTLASNVRRRQRNEQEHLAEERRRQHRMNQQKAVVTNAVKPSQPITRAVQEPTAVHLKELQTMMDMLDKSAREMKLRDQKREMESCVNKFAEISKRMQSCLEDGLIRYRDISDLEFRVSRILDDSKLCAMQVFQEHIEFVKQTFTPYLEDLRIELSERGDRRLEFNPPEEITVGLEMLANPVEVSASR